jgi:hypothetical protein
MPQSLLTGQFLKKSRHIGFGVFIVHSSMHAPFLYPLGRLHYMYRRYPNSYGHIISTRISCLQRRVLARSCFDAIVRDIAMVKEEATFNNSGSAEPEDWEKSAEQRHIFLSYQLVTHAVQYPDKRNVKVTTKIYCYVRLDIKCSGTCIYASQIISD